jgi:phosphate-selective porin OprO/OprP
MPSNTTSGVQNRAYGLELALANGPLKLQGEYTGQTFDSKNDVTGAYLDADVKAYYVEALWMITGENYSDWYKNGTWGAIKPKSNFDLETGSGMGAWEIGLRYDQFKVDDIKLGNGTGAAGGTRIQGSNASGAECTSTTVGSCNGGAKTWTAGLKWVLNPNMRMLLNYSHTKYDDSFIPVDVENGKANDKEDLLMLRTQVSF